MIKNTRKITGEIKYLIRTGTKDISANGEYDVLQYSAVNVDVPNDFEPEDEGKVVSNGELVAQSEKAINANDTYDTTLNNSVVVDVPNTYANEDEGKVVNNSALVSQTSRIIIENNTYDTTLNNEIVVEVPLPTGTINITQNGTHNVKSYVYADVNVPNPSTGTLTITENGTHDVTDYASANVNVPNTYTAQDEGKVVESGALVSQDGLSVTANGTYNTTKKNQVVVDVPTGDEWEEVLLWQKPEEITSYEANTAFASFDRSFGSYEYVKLQITGQNATQLRTFIIKNEAAYWPVFIGTNKCCRGFGRNELLEGYEFTTNTLAYQLSDTAVSPRYNNRILPLSIHGIRKKTQ